ncbi:ABC transporter permease [Salinarchaeum laminariae]|uniref:ABC transporter permease n=1 Tax=Salinarchaeum laminariae TaxID=869888 RepID=UPI0020BF6FFF|nr:ABC transporter permease [Salinarchaeum laminariae]
MKVKPTEEDTADDVRTDGGQMFDDAESTDVGAVQEYKEVLYEGLVAPAKIAWSDWRTKTGIIILGAFVLIAILSDLHQNGYTILNDFLGIVGSPWELTKPSSAFGCDANGNNCVAGYERSRQPFENWQTPLGTDPEGRDIFAGIVWATPRMLRMVLAGGVFSIAVATIVGTVAGYKGGVVNTVLMTLTDVAMSIPGLPLVIVIVAILDPTNPYLIGVVVTINVWAGLARTIQAQVLSLREQSYVEASRTMGIGTPSIIQKDILPNLMPYIMVNFVYSARRVIYDTVGLYFLGFLSYSTIANWGVMMNWAYANQGALAPSGPRYLIIVPMAPIVLLSFGLILLSQGTDRLFNPRVRTRHEGDTVEDHEMDDDDSVQPAMA